MATAFIIGGVLSCKWGEPIEPPVYTVVYDANGGDGTMNDSDHIYGKKTALNANAFTRTDYIFDGWAESPEGAAKYGDRQSVKNLNKKNRTTVTLYAVWAGFYTVVYDANGGSGEMPNSDMILGRPQKLRVNTFTRTAYGFAGWATSEAGTVEYTDGQSVIILTTLGAEVTLYAQWTQKKEKSKDSEIFSDPVVTPSWGLPMEMTFPATIEVYALGAGGGGQGGAWHAKLLGIGDDTGTGGAGGGGGQ
jgi:uncharacterized repeat protein (TIGR02543 family)